MNIIQPSATLVLGNLETFKARENRYFFGIF